MANSKKFRKKPVEIEAMELTEEYADVVADWCGGKVSYVPDGTSLQVLQLVVLIPTLEGVMTASEGDWIIKDVKGEFYPCKPDIFEATYEASE